MPPPVPTKKVRVRYIFEIQVTVPADWGKNEVEFWRNESSSCADNCIRDLMDESNRLGCLCNSQRCEYIEDVKEESESNAIN